jgi:hypothetical protein
MDDPNKKKEDALRVSLQQHEVRYLCEKFGVIAPVVEDVIKSHGPMRVDVERELQRLIEQGRP